MCMRCGYPLEYRNGTPVVSSFLKNLLFVANFTTWLVGSFMLAVGCYAKLDKAYTSGIAKLPIDPVAPILICGSLIFFMTFFGCVGALRENLCMLNFFSIVLTIALVMEVVAAFLTVALPDGVRHKIEEVMTDSIIHYRDDPDLQNLVDWAQEEFECCGVYNLHDWGQNIYFNCSDFNLSMERCGVPYSCCKLPDDGVVNTLCGMNMQSIDKYYAGNITHTAGCADAFSSWIHDNLFSIAFFIVILCCVPQIVGITMSRILIIQIKDQDLYIKIGLLNSRGDFEMNSY